jgi:hypothetical protein
MGASPRVVDWNNDGKKDLLTGGRDGTIRIYLNTNTDASPAFNGYTNIQVGGSDFIAGFNAFPDVVDWNNDGKKDLICGESFGGVYLLINTNTDADPQFSTSVFIQDGGSDLSVGLEANPAAADWNRDGAKDLLVGDGYGQIVFFENIGTDANPSFNGSVLLDAGGSTLDVGLYARPDTVDWDNDGVLDILCGCNDVNNGYVYLFRAQGPLSLSENALSQAAGGKIALTLNAGSTNGGLDYLVLGSVTGTSPGTPLPGGVVLPINWDVYTNMVIGLLNTAIFYNFMGTLNNSGEAEAVFNTLGPFSAVTGLVMSYAYGVLGKGNKWVFASNGANIEIVP